ncbi:MAG: hypothetical protein GXX83_10660 [Gaiellales bacterium]|nr:hypothetical protein [Gaiellales bacterium]
MPIGGYCEECGKWVWVTSSGECRHGHPASSVREVQVLKPAERPLGPFGRAPRPAQAERGTGRWWWRHSLWMVWTFTLGVLTWVSFVYVGQRARSRAWILWGLVYAVPMVLTIASIGSGYLQYAVALQVLVSIISIVHAFLIRPTYRAIMFGDPPSGIGPAPPAMLLERGTRGALPPGGHEAVGAVLQEAQSRVDGIAAAAEVIAKPEVRQAVGRLCLTAEQILEEILLKPGQAELARGFLNYYLEAADRIIRGYADLSGRHLVSAEVTQTLAQAEASLGGIQKAFDNQLSMLLQYRLLDLDGEISLLEKTVQMDGLAGPGASG